ncbi:MAG: SAF domain-containing protein [Candidatus Nanopelagicus sp.]
MKISKFDLFRNSRLVMGFALFIIALTAANLISKEANRTVLVWATTGELAPGQIIQESDITPASVLLAQSAKNYLSASAEIVGTTVLTKISAGDLIPVAAIGVGDNPVNQRFVPLTIEISDLPISLVRGDLVDLYAISKSSAKEVNAPALLASAITVEQVLERNNSGVVSVLVILENEQVLPTLNFLTDSRLILVRTR